MGGLASLPENEGTSNADGGEEPHHWEKTAHSREADDESCHCVRHIPTRRAPRPGGGSHYATYQKQDGNGNTDDDVWNAEERENSERHRETTY